MKVLTKALLEQICKRIYNELGPYHTELTYQNAMEHELCKMNISYHREKQMPIMYDNQIVGHGYLDFLVKPHYAIEFKALTTSLINKDGEFNKSSSAQRHHNQLYKYLQGLNLKTGFLINFNVGSKEDIEVLELTNPFLGDE